ncbi:MAG: MFS transporter [Myxococcota bacterium]
MERNLRLYPYFQVARSLLFWLPVFFLYFSAHLPADQVLLLEAVYYAGIVALEVPSGYLSDRIGRRPTLIMASGAWLLGYLVLAMAPSLEVFVVGQLLLAAGMAFNSGTDGALLYDSLATLEREDELADHEGRAQARGLLAMGFAALVGGGVGLIDLRLGHVLSAVSGAMALGVALAMVEPPAPDGRAHAPLRQLGSVVRHLRQPALVWVFLFAVVMTVFNHVPYMLGQPYLAAMLGDEAMTSTPVVSGLLMALKMTMAALASRASAPLAAKFGPAAVLLGAMVVQGLVIGSMGASLHPAVLALLLLSSMPGAVSGPVQLAVILPRVDGRIRATYLSIQSLAGRLSFSAALAVAAMVVGEASPMPHPAMATLCFGAVVGLAVMALVLLPWSRVVRDRIEA